tara:strand:+ start:460 stop:918 length:459 start_codon:yes stop_codon:yes gene_type:complete
MKKEKLHVARQKMAQKLNKKNLPQRPSHGWIRAIREALGMTTYQLADRLGISQSSAVGLEKREKQKTITLRSLETAARALNCRVDYILIPNEPFSITIRNRARLIARKRLLETAHSMELEDQSVSKADMKVHFDDLVQKLIKEGGSELWEDI